MKIRNYELFRIHAEYCKTLANSKRLMIMTLLNQREMSVGELATCMGVPLTTVSQQLRVLKNKNIVKYRKEGQVIYYRSVDPRLMEACTLIRTVLLDSMKHRGLLASKLEIGEAAS